MWALTSPHVSVPETGELRSMPKLGGQENLLRWKGEPSGGAPGEVMLLTCPSAAGVGSESLFFLTPRVELSFKPMFVAFINI